MSVFLGNLHMVVLLGYSCVVRLPLRLFVLLGYQSILQRLCATATLTVSSSEDSPTGPAPAGKLGSEFDLGFISHAQSNVGVNENVVRNVLFSAPWMLRLSNLHHFLAQHLSVYVSDCTAIYPPLTLQLPASHDDIEAGLIPLIKTTYSGNLATDLTTEASRDVVPSRPQSVSGHQSKSLLAISDSDLCMQWYRPCLDEYSIQPPQPSGKSTYSLCSHQLSQHSASVVIS